MGPIQSSVRVSFCAKQDGDFTTQVHFYHDISIICEKIRNALRLTHTIPPKHRLETGFACCVAALSTFLEDS